MSHLMLSLLTNATLETLYMVILSAFIAILLGFPLGVLLFALRQKQLVYRPKLYHSLAFAVNITRSIPFIILMMAVIPFTRLIVGSSIGTQAAIVPLSLCALPFFARQVEAALNDVNLGLIEAGLSMGASPFQIILTILIPESLPLIIEGVTLMSISLIGYSAMAGAVGGGGLGDLAIRYGYQRFDTTIMFLTLIIMIILVQCTQWAGDFLSKKMAHFKHTSL